MLSLATTLVSFFRDQASLHPPWSLSFFLQRPCWITIHSSLFLQKQYWTAIHPGSLHYSPCTALSATSHKGRCMRSKTPILLCHCVGIPHASHVSRQRLLFKAYIFSVQWFCDMLSLLSPRQNDYVISSKTSCEIRSPMHTFNALSAHVLTMIIVSLFIGITYLIQKCPLCDSIKRTADIQKSFFTSPNP